MLNCLVIMGRLTADPELRTTPSGTSVTSFTVAVDRNYCKQGEERQTDFIPVVAWRQTADFINRYFRKGSLIALQGEIQSRNYTDKNGNKRTAIELLVNQASFCGEKANSDNSPSSTENASGGDFGAFDEADDDGLPF